MRFKAEYVNRKTIETYWRTIDAESHEQAMKIADRFAKNEFTRVYMGHIFNKGD